MRAPTIDTAICAKVLAGERLSDDEALSLFHSDDLVGIGQLAELANRRLNHEQAFYNINRHINPTNVCALSCKFCSFSRKPGGPGAFALEIEEIVTRAGDAVAEGATEVHMVGGLHPRWSFERFVDMIAAVRGAYPDLHIKAFTAVELHWMARRARLSVEEVLDRLVAAGLSSLPGGGAEIFHPEIREVICDTKLTAEEWIATHRLAHQRGLRSNATMLYGHIESVEHRVDHLRRIRALQDDTGGFNCFIPLSFQPHDNDMGIDRYTVGVDDLKTLAIARLYLDNVPNLKSYWIMLGQDIAQLGLHFGANDLDGTVVDERISKMAGGRAGAGMARQRLCDMIERAGRIGVQRDTLYRPLETPKTPAAAAKPTADAAFRVKQAALAGVTPQSADLVSLVAAHRLHDLALASQAMAAEDGGRRLELALEEAPLSVKVDLTDGQVTGVQGLVAEPAPDGFLSADVAARSLATSRAFRLVVIPAVTEFGLDAPATVAGLVAISGACEDNRTPLRVVALDADERLTAVEFALCVSLARLVFGPQVCIETPLTGIPCHQGGFRGAGQPLQRHRVLKTAPFMAYLGSTSLGYQPELAPADLAALRHDCEAAAVQLRLPDALSAPLAGATPVAEAVAGAAG